MKTHPPKNPEYYIGLLSGTSVDAIDAAIIEINNSKVKLISSLNYPISDSLKQDLNCIIKNPNVNLYNLGKTHRELGVAFANAVIEIIKNSNLKSKNITAIGFHGQAILHKPQLPFNFTMQIGCASTIIEHTKIPVVTDFRQRDMVNGGQGAPLAPLFHQQFFSDDYINRAIVNIGGISNITLLEKKLTNLNKINIASDLGPGNTLLDQWYRKYNPNSYYDHNGNWAHTGTIHNNLLSNLLQDPYFTKPWPKSTGREYFNLNWLDNYLIPYNIRPNDVQRTLLELTAVIIANNVKNNELNNLNSNNITEAYICGGGANNVLLMSRINELLSPVIVYKTDVLNIPADWVEAALFAWLAYSTWNGHELNLKFITGNKNTSSLLGCIYY